MVFCFDRNYILLNINLIKTILLLFTLFGSFVLRTQDSIPDYFAANPKWEQHFGQSTEIKFFIKSDTLIGGKEYRKLMSIGGEDPYFDNREGNRLQGAIRQESVMKRCY